MSLVHLSTLRDESKCDISEDLIETLLKGVEEAIPAPGRIANWSVFSKEGRCLNTRTKGSCHYYWTNDAAFKPAFTVNRFITPEYKGKDVPESVKYFYNWLSKESPYKYFIISSSKQEYGYEVNRGLITTGYAPSHILQNINIITRHLFECDILCFDKFQELVENRKISPELAFHACFSTTFSVASTVAPLTIKMQNIVSCKHGGHRSSLIPSKSSLINFKNHEAFDEGNFKTSNWFANGCGTKEGGLKLFGQKVDNPKKIFETIMVKDKECIERVRNFRSSKAPSGEAYRPPNPFEATPPGVRLPRAGEITYEELFDIVLPYIEEKGIENVNA